MANKTTYNFIRNNIPNGITLFGLFLTLYSLYNFYYTDSGIYILLGAIGFHCDFIDGKIARKLNITSKLGNILDKTVDKINQSVLLIVFYLKYNTTILYLLLFLVRESIMYYMRINKLKSMASSKLAKIKTYIFPYIFILYWLQYTRIANILLACITLFNFYTLL
jgi:phosphatidylglycerophosphate synthase